MTEDRFLGALDSFLRIDLFTIGSATTTVARLLLVVAVLVATALVVRLAGKATTHHFRNHELDNSLELKTAVRSVQLVVSLVGIEIALLILGIHLTSILAAGGMVALAAGFAAKNIVENFLSGIILHLGQNIRRDDVIIVHDKSVRVATVGIRVTTGVTLDGSGILIPNSVVAQSIVENLTHHDRAGRISCVVGVAYSSDLRVVRRVLEEMVDGLSWRCRSKHSVVYLSDFGPSSVDYTIHVWIEEIANGRQRSSDLHEAVWWALKDAGVTIALPQLDVHFDEGVGEPRPAKALRGDSNAQS